MRMAGLRKLVDAQMWEMQICLLLWERVSEERLQKAQTGLQCPWDASIATWVENGSWAADDDGGHQRGGLEGSQCFELGMRFCLSAPIADLSGVAGPSQICGDGSIARQFVLGNTVSSVPRFIRSWRYR